MRPLILLLRLFVGGVFVVAGLGKVMDPRGFADLVAGYGILHPRLVALVAIVLPWLELTAGVSLVLGFLTESSALLLGLLSIGFGGAVTYALIRGMVIPCGCFGGDGPVSWYHLALDGGLALAAIGIFYRGPGTLALDLAFARPVTLDANQTD